MAKPKGSRTEANGQCEGAASYTAALAYTPSRYCSRTVPDLCTSSPIIDAIQGYISFFTSGTQLILTCLGMLMLVPSFAYTHFNRIDNFFTTKKTSNISITSSTGSVTAIKALSARSQMFIQGSGGPDYIAPLFMNRISLFGDGIPGSLLFSKLTLLLARINFYITKRILPDQISSFTPDILIGDILFQARTCWLDDCIDEFLSRNMGQKTNFVVLGAGYDTRCYRMGLRQRDVVGMFEIDTPATQKIKLRLVKECGLNTDGITFVPCDFEKDDWLTCLKESGFDCQLPTLIIWEGVTYYLTSGAIADTLKKVNSCAEGSYIAFDYFFSQWALSNRLKRMSKVGGEPLLFGMDSISQAENFVRSAGLSIWDHIQFEELCHRYIPRHFDGRPIGYLDDFGGFLLAGTT